MNETKRNLVVVAFDRTDTQGVADSVVKYVERLAVYEVTVVGPGHGRVFEDLSPQERARCRFFLELDAVSGVLYHTNGLETLSCPKLAWFVDSHKKPHFHAQIANDFDVVFHTARTWGGLFGERGRWLPVHYDAELIGPRERAVERYDVGFVGSQPKERTTALQAIAEKHGLSLLLETTTGPHEKELTADLYAQCRIVFNQHVANDLNFRVVEALGCRRLLLTDAQRNGQYELFEDRKDLVYYKDDRDLETLVLHYLAHPDERERIAASGHKIVSEVHTTEVRVHQLITAAERLVAERPAAALAEPRVSTGAATAPIQARYDHAYMLRNNYCVRSPEEARIKLSQAQVIARVLEPRRALVAGCAAGELMIPLLERGVDTWGFDFSEDLDAFAYPEVRGRVKRWDVSRVGEFPFEQAGGKFDTLVAIDLFEHIEEDRVDSMLDGIAASFERLAVVISSSPDFEGHVCVKPFPWWLERLAQRGFELVREPKSLQRDEVGVYGIKRFDGVREDMSEQIVFFRRTAEVRPSLPVKRAVGTGERPRVSIGVVCCDRADYLKVTLDSTRASLGSLATQVQWLAFENGHSSDVSRALESASVDIRLGAPQNLGLAPALDELYQASTGDYILTLEDDWQCLVTTPHWLEQAMAILDENPDVGVVRLRRLDDGQCGHFKNHRLDVALRHHPWSIEPLPKVVETRSVLGERFYVAPAEFVNWTNNPTLCRREVRDWIGSFASYLPDPRDHRPREGHPGLEGSIDERWRTAKWKVAKLLEGPYTHIGESSAQVAAS